MSEKMRGVNGSGDQDHSALNQSVAFTWRLARLNFWVSQV